MMWRLPSLLLSASSASHHFSDLSLSRARRSFSHWRSSLFCSDSLGLHTSRLLASRLLLLFNRSATLLSTLCAMCCSMADEASLRYQLVAASPEKMS